MCHGYGDVGGYSVTCCKWQVVQCQYTSRPADGGALVFAIVTGTRSAASPLHNLGLFHSLATSSPSFYNTVSSIRTVLVDKDHKTKSDLNAANNLWEVKLTPQVIHLLIYSDLGAGSLEGGVRPVLLAFEGK